MELLRAFSRRFKCVYSIYGMNENIVKMLELIRGPVPQRVPDPIDVVSVDGFIVERCTGRVVRRDLTLDKGKPYEHQPLYVYCRATRFEGLIRNSGVPFHSRSLCTDTFCKLEQAWLNNKLLLGNRKYFLSQRLILSEICRLNDIQYKFSDRRPIRDKRRWRIQQKLFSRLLKATKCTTTD